MKMDSKENNIKLARFVCQLSKKRENIINRQKALLDSFIIHYVRLITAHFIPISSYPYVGPKNSHTTIRCGGMVPTGLLLSLL